MSETLVAEEDAPAAIARTRLFARLSWALVALGCLFYLLHYLGHRSLWLDEAMVGLNVKLLNPAELTGKLDYSQLAPIGWLYLERAGLALTGSLEYGLRLVSLVSAIGGLVLFRQLAFKILPAFGAFSATLFFACNGALIRYAAEAKPYMLDVFLSVAALYVAFSILKAQRLTPLLAGLFALIGFATVTASFSAVYVLAAAGGAVFLTLALQKRFAAAGVVAAMAAAWLGIFAVLLLKVYFPQLEGNDLVEGGASTFFENVGYAPAPTSFSGLMWFASWAERYIDFLFRREAWFAIAALAGLGAVYSVRRNWPLAVMSLAPIAILLVVSSLKIFPAFERLTLFSAPGVILLAAAGAAWLARLSKGAVIAPLVLVLVIVGGSGAYIAGNLFKMRPPFAQQEIEPALEHLKAKLAPGETVFVTNMALPAYMIYRDQYGLQKAPFIQGKIPFVGWTCASKDLAAQATAPGRYWLLMVANEPPGELDMVEIEPVLAHRGFVGRFELMAQATQAWLYQVDLAARPEGATAEAPPEMCDSDGHNNNFDLPPRLKARLGVN